LTEQGPKRLVTSQRALVIAIEWNPPEPAFFIDWPEK
jgi:hypothetical protein